MASGVFDLILDDQALPAMHKDEQLIGTFLNFYSR
ncbi:hypothetical protein SAMN05421881_104418 [Nitrosomonas halophila]|uniref:Uncharacterized protein n=1 Tax=Nitrosomonas halophila TaxID=44576 RepID=A0A1H3L0X1_9PROT|nr:hypothetical protein SAMN05421881_104418 [Nitrosomonas halophila]